MGPMRSSIRVVHGTTGVVFDSPHSGTAYPEDFGIACPLETLRRYIAGYRRSDEIAPVTAP